MKSISAASKKITNRHIRPAGRIAIPLLLTSLLSACMGGSSAVVTDTQDLIADDVPQVSVSVASLPLVNADSDTDAANEAAITIIADRVAVGPVRVMAVGDSITHGVPGTSSYRREFTAQAQAANCSFKMVGSQQTSQIASRDQNCEDTGEIGDGWGWDGEKSCLVGAVSDDNVYHGAHEGYSAHRADHFLTGHSSAAGDNPGIGAAMAAHSPEVVLLHIGSVDFFNEQTLASTLIDIENVVDTIFETKPQTLVLIANIIPWFSSNPYPEIGFDIAAVGDGVEKLVADRQNPLLQLVDVRSGFTEAMMLSDLIHPNELGEAHIADAFLDVYQPLARCTAE